MSIATDLADITATVERALFAVARRKGRCGAVTRAGKPCRAKGRGKGRRCKLHGGASTGPTTPEGRARIAEAQRRRWASHRAARADHPAA